MVGLMPMPTFFGSTLAWTTQGFELDASLVAQIRESPRWMFKKKHKKLRAFTLTWPFPATCRGCNWHMARMREYMGIPHRCFFLPIRRCLVGFSKTSLIGHPDSENCFRDRLVHDNCKNIHSVPSPMQRVTRREAPLFQLHS